MVAGRLAYADPNLQVMLIEGEDHIKRDLTLMPTNFLGGANNKDDPWVYRPGIYVRNMQRDGMCVHL